MSSMERRANYSCWVKLSVKCCSSSWSFSFDFYYFFSPISLYFSSFFSIFSNSFAFIAASFFSFATLVRYALKSFTSSSWAALFFAMLLYSLLSYSGSITAPLTCLPEEDEECLERFCIVCLLNSEATSTLRPSRAIVSSSASDVGKLDSCLRSPDFYSVYTDSLAPFIDSWLLFSTVSSLALKSYDSSLSEEFSYIASMSSTFLVAILLIASLRWSAASMILDLRRLALLRRYMPWSFLEILFLPVRMIVTSLNTLFIPLPWLWEFYTIPAAVSSCVPPLNPQS